MKSDNYKKCITSFFCVVILWPAWRSSFFTCPLFCVTLYARHLQDTFARRLHSRGYTSVHGYVYDIKPSLTLGQAIYTAITVDTAYYVNLGNALLRSLTYKLYIRSSVSISRANSWSKLTSFTSGLEDQFSTIFARNKKSTNERATTGERLTTNIRASIVSSLENKIHMTSSFRFPRNEGNLRSAWFCQFYDKKL
jgi:hypothetical protein